MNRVGSNIVLGTLWVTAGIGMLFAEGDNQLSAAILIVLGFVFYWAAYKIYVNPNLAKKNGKNLIQKTINQSSAKNIKVKKKK